MITTHQLSNMLPEIPPDSIISRTIFSDEKITAVLFGFAPGSELSEHTSAKPAVLQFLSGEADVTLGGESLEGAPGAWVHMPPNTPHSIKARTNVSMLLLLLG